jgi:hypothetical protein
VPENPGFNGQGPGFRGGKRFPSGFVKFVFDTAEAFFFIYPALFGFSKFNRPIARNTLDCYAKYG